MVAAFEATLGESLPERLLTARAAGHAAGGEDRPLRSAAMLVVHEQSCPYADLRVAAADAPIDVLALRRAEYAPMADEYVTRALDPCRTAPPTL